MPENIVSVVREKSEGGTRQVLQTLTIGPSDVLSLETDEDGHQSVILTAQSDEHLDAVVLKTMETVRVTPSTNDEMAAAQMAGEGGVVTGVDPDGEGPVEPEPEPEPKAEAKAAKSSK